MSVSDTHLPLKNMARRAGQIDAKRNQHVVRRRANLPFDTDNIKYKRT